MGFDLRILEPLGALPAQYAPQYVDAPEYFRIPVAAMEAMRAALRVADVLDESARTPSFPPWPPPEAQSDFEPVARAAERTSLEPPSTATELAALDAYRARRATVLRTTSGDPARVPAFKLGSNDGWIVSAPEAHAIAAGLRAALAADPDALHEAMRAAGSPLARPEALAWVAAFAAYNELAAEHGGYRVA